MPRTTRPPAPAPVPTPSSAPDSAATATAVPGAMLAPPAENVFSPGAGGTPANLATPGVVTSGVLPSGGLDATATVTAGIGGGSSGGIVSGSDGTAGGAGADANTASGPGLGGVGNDNISDNNDNNNDRTTTTTTNNNNNNNFSEGGRVGKATDGDDNTQSGGAVGTLRDNFPDMLKPGEGGSVVGHYGPLSSAVEMKMADKAMAFVRRGVELASKPKAMHGKYCTLEVDHDVDLV